MYAYYYYFVMSIYQTLAGSESIGTMSDDCPIVIPLPPPPWYQNPLWPPPNPWPPDHGPILPSPPNMPKWPIPPLNNDVNGWLYRIFPFPGSTITAWVVLSALFLTCISYTRYPFSGRRIPNVDEVFGPTAFWAIPMASARLVLTFEDKAPLIVLLRGIG